MHFRIAVLADAANVTPDGKLNILGEFNLMNAPTFPSVWPRLFVVLKLEFSGSDPRQFTLQIRLLDPDGHVMQQLAGPISRGPDYEPGVPGAVPFFAEIRNMVLVKKGDYVFEVTTDFGARTAIPVFVRETQPRAAAR